MKGVSEDRMLYRSVQALQERLAAEHVSFKRRRLALLRVVVRCPVNLDLHILTDLKVDERFLPTVQDTFVSAECPHCLEAHIKQLKFCRTYKLRGAVAPQAA
jgi:hypothetical protein